MRKSPIDLSQEFTHSLAAQLRQIVFKFSTSSPKNGVGSLGRVELAFRDDGSGIVPVWLSLRGLDFQFDLRDSEVSSRVLRTSEVKGSILRCKFFRIFKRGSQKRV